MGRIVLLERKMLPRLTKQVERHLCNFALKNEMGKSKGSTEDEKREDGLDWVPHPRNGIYVPKGHEGVMDDVPVQAATFNQTYWLRSIEGVEKLSPDVSLDYPLPKNQ